MNDIFLSLLESLAIETAIVFPLTRHKTLVSLLGVIAFNLLTNVTVTLLYENAFSGNYLFLALAVLAGYGVEALGMFFLDRRNPRQFLWNALSNLLSLILGLLLSEGIKQGMFDVRIPMAVFGIAFGAETIGFSVLSLRRGKKAPEPRE